MRRGRFLPGQRFARFIGRCQKTCPVKVGAKQGCPDTKHDCPASCVARTTREGQRDASSTTEVKSPGRRGTPKFKKIGDCYPPRKRLTDPKGVPSMLGLLEALGTEGSFLPHPT